MILLHPPLFFYCFYFPLSSASVISHIIILIPGDDWVQWQPLGFIVVVLSWGEKWCVFIVFHPPTLCTLSPLYILSLFFSIFYCRTWDCEERWTWHRWMFGVDGILVFVVNMWFSRIVRHHIIISPHFTRSPRTFSLLFVPLHVYSIEVRAAERN
jgi:hypothetical protein